MELQKSGQIEEARAAYELALGLADSSVPSPNLALAHYNVAAIAMSGGGLTAAALRSIEIHLEAAAELDPARNEFRER